MVTCPNQNKHYDLTEKFVIFGIWRFLNYTVEFIQNMFVCFSRQIKVVNRQTAQNCCVFTIFFSKKNEHFYVDFFRLKKVYSPSLSSQRRKRRACMLNFSFRSFFQVVLRSCRVATSRPRPSQSRPSYCVKQSTKKEPQFSVAWISSSKS